MQALNQGCRWPSELAYAPQQMPQMLHKSHGIAFARVLTVGLSSTPRRGSFVHRLVSTARPRQRFRCGHLAQSVGKSLTEGHAASDLDLQPRKSGQIALRPRSSACARTQLQQQGSTSSSRECLKIMCWSGVRTSTRRGIFGQQSTAAV